MQAPPLAWSTSIAASATRHAQRCTWQHSSSQDRNGYGENLYFSKGMDVPTIGARASKEWYEEVKDYNFGSPGQALRYGAMIGHFTAMVWADTKAIGKTRQSSDDTILRKPHHSQATSLRCSMEPENHLSSCQRSDVQPNPQLASGTQLLCCLMLFRLCIRPLPLASQWWVQ